MIDGVTAQPFSAITLPPIAKRTNSEAEVIQWSRETYAGDREEIERGVIEWTGLEGKSVDDSMEIAKAKGTGNPPKKKYKYKCSWTGKEFSIPVKLDRSRPIYSEEGKEIVREAKKNGAYDARKDLIYDENLEPVGSVAELGFDGLWALKNEEGDIIGRKDEEAVKRDRKEAKEAERSELAEKVAKVKETMGVEEPPKPAVGIGRDLSAPAILKPLVAPGASLDVLKTSVPDAQKKRRKRSRKKKSAGGQPSTGLTASSSSSPTPQQSKPTTDDAPKPPTRLSPGKTVMFDE